jgi:hypothetical protein
MATSARFNIIPANIFNKDREQIEPRKNSTCRLTRKNKIKFYMISSEKFESLLIK